MLSWNKIKEELLTLCQNHKQINSFGTGDALQIGTENVLNLRTADRDRIAYPLVFASLNSSQVVGTQSNLNVSVIFMDKVEPLRDKPENPTDWKDNEDEVMSDMHLIALDFIAYFTDDPDFNYTIDPNVSLDPFFNDRTQDVTAGWIASFSFISPFSRNVCLIPD